MTPVRIQRKRTKGWKMPPNTVCVTRPGKWGNPFYGDVLGPELAVKLYRDLVAGIWDPSLLKDKDDATFSLAYRCRHIWIERFRRSAFDIQSAMNIELKGKNLACFCKPDEPCHADVLLEIANAPRPEQKGGE